MWHLMTDMLFIEIRQNDGKRGSARQKFFPSTMTREIQNTNVTFIISEAVSLLVKALFSVTSLLMETFSYVRTHFYRWIYVVLGHILFGSHGSTLGSLLGLIWL